MKSRYYYASGNRVRLEPAEDVVAVDTDRLDRASIRSSVRKKLLASARRLKRPFVLCIVNDLPSDVLDDLREARAIQPVFRHGEDLLVALPEVRVEESRSGQVEKLQRWLEKAGDAVAVEGDPRRRLTLRPASGQGEDALEIANALHESIDPELAQPRFLRVVSRPDPGRA